MEQETALRRQPNQRRSRERVERILDCATRLIGEVGSDGMRMSELARRAGMSIGALYQYFPDKAAIVRTLTERYNAAGRQCISEGLADVTTVASLQAAFGELMDTYYGLFLADPAMRDIWAGAQADPALRDLEVAESRLNAALLGEAMARVHPGADRDALDTSALLIMYLGESTMRLAVLVGREKGDALVAAYTRMAQAELGAPPLTGSRSR